MLTGATFVASTLNPGNQFTAADTFTLQASMTDPGSPLRGTVTLNATASDTSSSISSVAIQRSAAGAESWSDVCTDTTSPYSCAFDTTSVGDGLYDFRAIATNALGATQPSTPVTDRRVDNTAPTVAMSDPGAWLRGTVSLASTSSDGGSGMASVRYQYKLGAGAWNDACTGTTTPFACSFNTTALTNGSNYDFRAIATDVAGNTQTSSQLSGIRADNAAPTSVTINNPGSPLTGTIALSGGASDSHSGIASITFQRSPAGAGNWSDACTDTTAPYSCSFDTSGLTDGLYDFRARATDVAGNATNSTATTNRRIDNTAPSATMSDPGAWMNGTETLSASASDPGAGSGVTSVKIQYSPTGAGNWTDVCTDTTSPYSCNLITTTLVNGNGYDLRAVATDGVGLSGSHIVYNRRVDNAAPSATITDPGSPLTATVALSADAADSHSGVASVTIQRSPAGVGTWTDVCTDGTSTYSCDFDTSGVTDGLYDFRAVTTDLAGNAANSTATTNRRIDNSAPSVSMSDPGWLAASEQLSATASDGGGTGVGSVKIQYSPTGADNWTDVCTDASSPYNCTLDASGLTEGDGYDFRAIATDGAGFTNTSAVVANRRVDRTAPASATMNDPGSPLSGTVTLSGDATDALSGVASLKIQRSPAGAGNWSDICTDTTSPYSCSFNTASVADGNYDFRAVAADQAGNTTTSNVVANRRTENNAPSAADIQTANGGGGTVGVVNAGDSITFTYSESMDPDTIFPGWNGSAQAVTVRIIDGSDNLEVWNLADTSQLNLTSGNRVELGANFVPPGGAKFDATIVMSGPALTVTLDSLRSGSVEATPTGTQKIKWTPSSLARDLSGNATSTTVREETGTSDVDF